MINFDQFIDKWLGKKIDYDGHFEGQCMDLYHQYVKEVLGSEHPGAAYARQLWDKTYRDYDKIKNTLLGIPKKGDIVIWNGNEGGGAGHVAIYIEGNVMSFTSLDQNYPTLNKVTKTKHSYKNILGWLRPKKPIDNPDWLIKNSDAWIGILTYLEITKKDPTLDDAKNVVAGYKARATAMEKEKGQWEAKYNAEKEVSSNLNTQLTKAQKDLKDSNTKLNESDKNLNEANGKVSAMIDDKKIIAIQLSECKAKREYNVKLRIRDWFLGRYK